MFGRSKMARKLGELHAETVMEVYLEQGATPAPWPLCRKGIRDFVDAVAPLEVQKIGAAMAQQAGSMIAMPKWVIAEIDRGFRKRLEQLMRQIFKRVGS